MSRKAEYEALKASGTCTQCTSRPAREGRVLCESCAADQSRRVVKRVMDLKAQGLCGCRRPIALERSNWLCEECLKKQSKRSRQRFAQWQQEVRTLAAIRELV